MGEFRNTMSGPKVSEGSLLMLFQPKYIKTLCHAFGMICILHSHDNGRNSSSTIHKPIFSILQDLLQCSISPTTLLLNSSQNCVSLPHATSNNCCLVRKNVTSECQKTRTNPEFHQHQQTFHTGQLILFENLLCVRPTWWKLRSRTTVPNLPQTTINRDDSCNKWWALRKVSGEEWLENPLWCTKIRFTLWQLIAAQNGGHINLTQCTITDVTKGHKTSQKFFKIQEESVVLLSVVTVKLRIEAGYRIDAGPRIQAGGLTHLYW